MEIQDTSCLAFCYKETEEEGFEPSRRCYRPTGVRSQTLQPLGYSSGLIDKISLTEKTAGKIANDCIIH